MSLKSFDISTLRLQASIHAFRKGFSQKRNQGEYNNFLKYLPVFHPTYRADCYTRKEVSRRTGISTSRLSELTLNAFTKLQADELYLNSLAIDVDGCDVLKAVCGHLKLGK